jgi:phospholipid N-methyltransferase
MDHQHDVYSCLRQVKTDRNLHIDRTEKAALSIQFHFRSRALLFARNFFRHPKMLGSLIPSSRYLASHLLEQIDFERARFIVEYGPGIGNITQELLKRMTPQSKLIVIETNKEFVSFLKANLRDKRLHVVCGSAAEVFSVLEAMNLRHADYIISGIPYSTMPDVLRRQILHESRRVLHPEGAFLIYQFTRTVLPHLEATFNRVDQEFEPRNILPARLFYCTR